MIKLSESKRLSGELSHEQLELFDRLWIPKNHAENRYPCQVRTKWCNPSFGSYQPNFSRWEAYPVDFALSPLRLVSQLRQYISDAVADSVRFYFKRVGRVLYVVTDPFERRQHEYGNLSTIEQYRWEVPTEIISELESV